MNRSTPAHPSLSRLRILAYATGSIGAGLYSTVPGILLLYYMTQSLGLPVSMASLVVLVPKLAVVFIDPLIGTVSDGMTSRWGRRRPFLLSGALLSGLTFVLLFSLPALGSHVATALLMGVAYFATSISFSIFAVPYVAMPAELAPDSKTQSALIGTRMFFMFAGVLSAAVFAPVLVDTFGGGSRAYSRMALILAGLSTTSMLISATLSPASPDPVHRRPLEARDIVRIFAHIPFSLSLLTYAVAITATAVTSAAVPYFMVFSLARPESDIAIVFLSQILICLALMPVWSLVAPRIGPARTLAVACLISACGSLAFRLLTPESSLVTIAVTGAINGVGLAGVQVAAFALLAQLTNHLNHRMEGRFEGIITGLWTATEKLALAVGPTICAVTLSLGGFVSKTGRELLPDTAIQATMEAMSSVPAVIALVAAGLIFLYRGMLTDGVACETTSIHTR